MEWRLKRQNKTNNLNTISEASCGFEQNFAGVGRDVSGSPSNEDNRYARAYQPQIGHIPEAALLYAQRNIIK